MVQDGTTQIGREAVSIKNVVAGPQLAQDCGTHAGKELETLNSAFPSFCEHGRNFCGAHQVARRGLEVNYSSSDGRTVPNDDNDAWVKRSLSKGTGGQASGYCREGKR